VANAKALIKDVAGRLGYEVVKRGTLADLTIAHHVAEVLKRARINCVIDVGGNIGWYGEFLRAIGYDGRIVSFEPVSDSFAELGERAAADPHWTAHRLAIGSTTGAVTMNVASNRLFSSVREPSSEGAALFPDDEQIERQEEVELRRVDDVFADCVAGIVDPRVHLKSHAQGSDLEVIRGANGSLDRIHSLQLYVALQRIYDGMPTHRESFELVEGLGFAVTGLFPVTRDDGFRVIEYDCICVRR
jgi:FkbM family methyltransferase